MVVKLGLSLWGRNKDWGFLRTECRGNLDLKGRETNRGANCIMMILIAFILHRILLGWLNQWEWGGWDMCHAWGNGQVFAGFWLGGPKVRDHWEDLGAGGRIALRWNSGRKGSMGRTVFGWFRIGSSGGLLRARKWTFEFQKESRLLFDRLRDY
jgi:hypothetical protein